MHSIVEVEVLDGYRLLLVFDDGVSGEVDLSRLVGSGVFAAWKEPSHFHQVSITPTGALSWANDIDLCADSLYLQATGKTPEELFPALADEALNA